jgi:hypothetical protein
MKKRQIHTVFFVFLVAALATSATGAVKDVQILSSTDRVFHFIVSVDASLSRMESFEAAQGGSIFGRTVLVGIPQGATARLTSADGSNPVPVTRQLNPDVTYRTPSALAHLSEPFTIRGRRMVNVLVTPVSGSGVFSRIEIEIAFEGGTGASTQTVGEGRVFDRVFESIMANYETARYWPTQARRSPTSAALESSSLQQADKWYKVTVAQTGLHVITGSQLAAAGISISGLLSDDIRLFNTGGLRLPESNDSARPVLDEVALLIEDGGDGVFHSSDRLYFFGESVDRWLFPPNVSPSYVHNPYTTENMYWLAVSGTFPDPSRRMQAMDGSITAR